MKIVVVSIGRLKQGPERELAERYRERFEDVGRKLGFRGLEIHEIPESRARDVATRIAEEATDILETLAIAFGQFPLRALFQPAD